MALSPGKYGFYEHTRATPSPDIVTPYEKTKLLEQRAKREDERFDLRKQTLEAAKKKANEIEIKAVDEFHAFAGQTGATAARLTGQAGKILVNAKRMVDAGQLSKDQYVQLELNLQAGVHSYNEVSETREAEYKELMGLDEADYRDGELKKAQEIARKSFLNTYKVHYKNDGTLFFLPEENKPQSIGEFYQSTQMPSIKKARHDILGDVRTGIKDPIISQILAKDGNGMWYAQEIRGDQGLEAQIMADADISSFEKGGIDKLKGYNFEDVMEVLGNPELNEKEAAKAGSDNDFMTEDSVYDLYTQAAQNEAKDRNIVLRKAAASKSTKGETYYPELTKTTVYSKTYGDEKVVGKTAIIDVSRIKGSVAKESVIGQVVEMIDGNPVIIKGQFAVEDEIPEVKGMKGQIKQIIKLNKDPYYYVEMVSISDQDLTAAFSGIVDDRLAAEILRKYKDQPVMLRLDKQQMEVLQNRIPGALDVFGTGTVGELDEL